MPLSPPAPRKLIHTRTITCRGHERDDGLWDIEGHLVDTKTYDMPSEDRDGGTIKAGEHLHEMWLRLTVDTDLLVHAVEAVTDHGPYSVCPDITPSFRKLEGLSIKPGWTMKTRQLLGGVNGCTHLVELLGPVATTAFQTVYASRVKRDQARGHHARPVLINSCHAYSESGPLVQKRFPQYFKPR